MKRSYAVGLVVLLIILIVIVGHRYWRVPVTTVIFVRHAEKAAAVGDDPPLTLEGMERAKQLAHVLESAGIDVIFATGYQRTQATVAPTASALGLTPIIVNDTQELARTILADHRGRQILVAGHADTVPLIMEALGISPAPQIVGNSYDNLFIVQVVQFITRHAKVTHLKYGSPSP